MKKVLGILVLSLVVVGSLFAGGQTEAPVPVIWAKSGPEGEALQAAAQAYKDATGKTVSIVIQGRANYRSAYNTALLAGSKDLDAVHDVAFVIPSLAAGGHIVPVDSYINKSAAYDTADFQDVIQREMKFKDKWYMFPSDISSESLVYRTDLIGEAPKTWDELVEIAKKFTRSINPDSPTQYGYAFAAAPGVLEGTFQGIMKAYGASLVDDDGTLRIADPKTVQAFQMFVDMRNKHKVVPSDVIAWDYPELLTALQEGIVPMAAFFTAGMPVLVDSNQSPKVAGNIAYSKQPAGPFGAYTRINPLGFMVNAKGRNTEGAIEFLMWLTGKEGSYIYTKAGGSSPRKSVLEREEFYSARPWYPEMLKAAEQGVGSIRLAEQAMIRNTFNKWASQALNGDLSVEQAFGEATKELSNLL